MIHISWEKKLYWVDGCWMLDGWMLDVEWLEKAELKPTQPSLAGAWLSLATKVGTVLLDTLYVQNELIKMNQPEPKLISISLLVDIICIFTISNMYAKCKNVVLNSKPLLCTGIIPTPTPLIVPLY